MNVNVIWKRTSPDQSLTVYETTELYGERGRFRVLAFSEAAVQGAIDLSDPDRFVLEYPRAMLHVMECTDPTFEDVFLIGHGVGTMPGRLQGKRLRIAELDADVAELSASHFGYRGVPPVIGDGRLLLEREAPQSLDFVVVDAFTEDGVPDRLVDADFFRLAREKLDDRGAALFNVTVRGERDLRTSSVFAALRAEFAYAKAFVLPSANAADQRNAILVGGSSPIRYQARRMAGFVEVDRL
ncbi:spermidine synthase [Paenibacillus antri]|uniref:spermidine synthase n=1 Tax=Paenibacillus antri TaxID=2582848 RepID=UPI001EE49AB5|nr:fused MFS/spermidine synthase [Paenibacillus antri]